MLGYGIQGEYREEHVNNVKDEYLDALQGLLQDCRDWQIFRMSNADWMAARVRFSKVYTSRVDAASVDKAIEKLAALFSANTTPGSPPSQEQRDEADAYRKAETDQTPSQPKSADDDIVSRIASIQSDLAELKRRIKPPPPGSDPGSIQVSSDPPPSTAVSQILGRWPLHFGIGSSQVSIAELQPVVPVLNSMLSKDRTLRVEVVGFSDDVGNKAGDLRLAMRRVSSVRRALEKQSIATFAGIAHGETAQFGPGLAQNRIAQIVVYREAP